MKRIALVGVGFMGKTHLGIWSKLPGAKLEALCDIRKEVMEASGADAGGNIKTAAAAVDLSAVRRYTDFGRMLEEGGFDIVDICLPTYLHAEYSIKALEKGFHVFCEKPLALTAAEADGIVRTVRKTGNLMSVGQCLRYWPAYTETKRLLDSGKYGRVRYAEFARFSNPPTWGWDGWLLDSKRSGNAALDMHVHDVDMVLHLFGAPQSVRSAGDAEKDGGLSHIATLYSYPDKVVSSTGGWTCSKSFGFNMRAHFVLEKATIELDFRKNPAVMAYPDDGEAYALPLAEGDGYFYELRAFLSGVEAGKLETTVTVETAAQSVKLCLEEIRSAKDGKERKVRL
jgi:predicted dehydrogenase